MRNWLYLIILLSLLPLSGYAQLSLHGTVADAGDQKSIEFATVTLFNEADSSLVNGTVTDTAGLFTLSDVHAGQYYLRISFMGYSTQWVRSIVVDGTNPSVTIEPVFLTPSGTLNSVDVTTNAAVFETKIDKKVFNAADNLTSKGGSGLDLLRQIPTITVDENNNILLRGDANVTILIDGRPSAMPASQLLRQLPASAIEKVEIITNPSAKYDPEGVSGIINIILVKNQTKGLNGTWNGTVDYGKFLHANSTLNLNYRTPKFNLFTNYSFFYDKTWFGGSLDRDVMLNDSTWDHLRSTDYGERLNTYHSVQAGVDYFINEQNTLYLTANYDYGTNYGNRLMDYTNVDDAESRIYSSQRFGEIQAPSYYYVLTGGWQKSFKNPEHTLFVDFNYTQLDFDGDEWLWHKYYDSDQLLSDTRYQHTLDQTHNRTLLGKLDYVLPIGDSSIFEAGFHYTQRIADNDFFSESALSDQIYSTDTTISNHFRYTQHTFAPYVTFSRQFKKLGIKGGLRAEPTLTLSEMITTKENFEQNYFQLFPSLYLTYTIDDYTVLQLSYSRRINRPELDQLNPFTNYSDNLTLETGNPFLKPEIIHVNEISYMKFWQKFNINATGYFRVINDLIRRELFYDGIYTHVTNTNLGSSFLSGGDLILTYSPVKGMRLISSTSVWNTSTKDPEVTNGSWQNYTGMYTSLMASYKAKKGWTFQLWGSHSPTARVIQGYILRNYGGGFAIQKSMLNDKAQLNISVYDVLKSRWFAFESYDLGNYQMTSIRRWESRHVSVSFTYNFGKMTEGKERRRNNSGSIEDNLDVPLSN